MSGKTVYILASGSSLDGFDYSLLDGKTVIAINDAGIKQYPFAPFLISTDDRWWASIAVGERDLKKWRGHTAICTEFEAADGIVDNRIALIARVRKYGLSENRGVLYGIYTGVHAAINYAVLYLGARKIVLLGVDLSAPGPGGRKYTYGGETTVRTDRQFLNMKRALESCAETLKEKGIDVVNASEISALGCWPRCKPTEAFEPQYRPQASDDGELVLGEGRRGRQTPAGTRHNSPQHDRAAPENPA